MTPSAWRCSPSDARPGGAGARSRRAISSSRAAAKQSKLGKCASNRTVTALARTHVYGLRHGVRGRRPHRSASAAPLTTPYRPPPHSRLGRTPHPARRPSSRGPGQGPRSSRQAPPPSAAAAARSAGSRSAAAAATPTTAAHASPRLCATFGCTVAIRMVASRTIFSWSAG